VGAFVTSLGRSAGTAILERVITEEDAVAARAYVIHCAWDPEAAVWVAASEDVPGLATGAETLDALIDKLKVVIPELLEANSLLPADHQGHIPFDIIAERHERAPVAA
jgi:predicted RNase H-like HicB family nuclease